MLKHISPVMADEDHDEFLRDAVLMNYAEYLRNFMSWVCLFNSTTEQLWTCNEAVLNKYLIIRPFLHYTLSPSLLHQLLTLIMSPQVKKGVILSDHPGLNRCFMSICSHLSLSSSWAGLHLTVIKNRWAITCDPSRLDHRSFDWLLVYPWCPRFTL